MDRPRLAIFDFACCEGCQLQIVNLEEELLDLVDAVQVVEWREAMSEQSREYDIAIIEGSITRFEDEKRLEIIRTRAKKLIALGACATIGGINKLKNNFDLQDVKQCVYGKSANMPHLDTMLTKAVDEVVKVD
jgi:coenzyme F420-reducing hydrogenase gamma subunit